MSKLDQLRALREATATKRPASKPAPKASPKPIPAPVKAGADPRHAAYLAAHPGLSEAWLRDAIANGFRFVSVGGRLCLTDAPEGAVPVAKPAFDKTAYQREYMRKRRAAAKASG